MASVSFLGLPTNFQNAFSVGAMREGFKLRGLALHPGHDDPLAQVSDDHQAVFAQVFCDLLAARDRLDILVGRFDFDDAPRGNQPVRERIVGFGFLVGGYQCAVRKARADAARMNNAAHLRFELLADDIEKIRQVRIVGRFLHAHAADVRVAKIREKTLDVCVVWQRLIIAQRTSFQ